MSGTTKHGLQEFWIVILFKLRLVVFEMGRTKQRQPKAAGSFAFYSFQIPRIRVLLIPYDQCRSRAIPLPWQVCGPKRKQEQKFPARKSKSLPHVYKGSGKCQGSQAITRGLACSLIRKLQYAVNTWLCLFLAYEPPLS